MADSEAIADLIREIAVKHGVAVSRNDPILILQTINARLMQDSAKAQETILEAYKSELEGIAQRWGVEAKGMAERVLNEALRASKQAMASGMAEATAATAQAIRGEVAAAVGGIAKPLRETRRLTKWNIFAASVSVVAALLTLAATLWR